MFPERFETERLVFERFCHENVDLQELYRIYSDDEDIAEVFRYQTWSPHETIKETYDLIEDLQDRWEARDRASYFVIPKPGEPNAGELAGDTGIDVHWDRRTGNVGIWLRKKFWGRGYSQERAVALMELAFETLDLEVVVAECIAANENARRSIEKYVDEYGGRHDGTLRNGVSIEGEIYDIHRYSVTREEFRASRASE